MDGSVPVIQVSNLVVDYGRGTNRHRAVNDISFTVNQGECVGFIGANGAGKSTTMKTLMGFTFPTSGSVSLFGEPCGTAESRQRVGYLPEVALYYPFMKARELLELYGGLSGLTRAQLRDRIPATLARVGLEGRGEKLLREFSKGMQQRLGIAQAIISEPELLIFDELSSGLDPVGRFDLREVLLDLKRQGRTIFFSSHELSEVETLCDRVIMIHRGRVVTQATVRELMKPLNVFQITYRIDGATRPPEQVTRYSPTRDGAVETVSIPEVDAYSAAISALSTAGIGIQSTSSKTRSLEEYFIDLVRGEEKGRYVS